MSRRGALRGWAVALAGPWALAACGASPPGPFAGPSPARPAPRAGGAPTKGGEVASPWLEVFRERARRAPDDGALLYNLAALCDLAGAPDEALAWLRRLDRLGWGGPPRDEHFPVLRDRPEFRALAASFAAREPRAQSGRVAFTVPELDLIPAGIAYDERAGDVFLSSIAERKIVRVGADGRASGFVPTARDGLGGVPGLHVDARRGLLWAVSNPLPNAGGAGERALFGFDLATGGLRHKLAPPPGAPGPTLLNDVSVGPGGDLFVTDSDAGAVYVAHDAAGPLAPRGTWSGPNGVAFSDEAGVLLVAHDVGLVAVDPKAVAWREVAAGPGRARGSFDGIAVRGRALFGVQNGLGAPRVVRAELDAAATRVVALRALEAASPALELPTTGGQVGDSFYVMANSQCGRARPRRPGTPGRGVARAGGARAAGGGLTVSDGAARPSRSAAARRRRGRAPAAPARARPGREAARRAGGDR